MTPDPGSTPTLPPESEIEALVGHRFPGGTYAIEHWENHLLTECTGSDPLPDGLVHPVCLFHVPINGCGVTLAELFALGRAKSDSSIGIEGYDWEYFAPIVEDVDYTLSGSIIEAERRRSSTGRVHDAIGFRIDMADPAGAPVARVTCRWLFRRSGR